MKKIKYMALALAGLFVVSCADFMERKPLSSIDEGAYWTKLSDLQLYLNSLYSENLLLPLDNGYGGPGPYDDDAQNGTDVAMRYNYNTRMNSEDAVPDNDNGWGNADWAPLRSINYFMDNYGKVEKITGPAAVKPYVGEALFFRTMFYFKQLRNFGDLPWVSTTLDADSEELMGARLPRNDVAMKMLADIDSAILYLPARGAGAWTGRVTKEAALALKSRVFLYEGTWEKYHKGTVFAAKEDKSDKFLTEAAKAAGDLIALSEANGYPALYTAEGDVSYQELFAKPDYTSNSEVLMFRKYQAGQIINYWQGYSYCSGGEGVTKSMIDSYLKADGTPLAPAQRDYSSLSAIAEGRDPRLAMSTFIDDGKHYYWEKSSPVRYFCVPYFDGWDADESQSNGFGVYKGHNPHFDRTDYNVIHNSLIYFRYGETLLNYAEAKAELGTLTQDDLDKSINKLRDRVGMPDMTLGTAVDPNFEFSDLNGNIQAIRRERKVELAHEGFRYDDIMRWAAADELIVGKIHVGAPRSWWGVPYNAAVHDSWNWVSTEWQKDDPKTTANEQVMIDVAENGGKKWAKYTYNAGKPDESKWVMLYIDGHPYGASEKGRQLAWSERVAKLTVNSEGFITFTNASKIPNGFGFKVGRDYLRPIPTTQATLNPALGQNPGWGK